MRCSVMMDLTRSTDETRNAHIIVMVNPLRTRPFGRQYSNVGNSTALDRERVRWRALRGHVSRVRFLIVTKKKRHIYINRWLGPSRALEGPMPGIEQGA
jgi:hypothetical protein